MSRPVQYVFFDVGLDVDLPPETLRDWDVLYGAFSSTQRRPARKVHRVSYVSSGSTGGEWSLDGGRLAMPRGSVMPALQELVQHQLLRTVESHLLWHGALWLVRGKPLLILADSGVGKSTLSLAHLQRQGTLLSDEIAACELDGFQVAPFPRSMALRAASVNICRYEGPGTAVDLEEPKLIVPIGPLPELVSGRAAAVVFLEWAADPAETRLPILEIRMAGPVRAALTAMKARARTLVIEPHPDDAGWMRMIGAELPPLLECERIAKQAGCVIAGVRRYAARRPDYRGSPVAERISADVAARRAMSHLVNARRLVERYSAPYVMGLVREVMQRAACYRMVPGELTQSLAELYRVSEALPA